ncbi:MAG: hypothetical protein LBU78_05185, partial [Microbacterium sp.]|nr:hypothetical protein [Microbacterium sp.]
EPLLQPASASEVRTVIAPKAAMLLLFTVIGGVPLSMRGLQNCKRLQYAWKEPSRAMPEGADIEL